VCVWWGGGGISIDICMYLILSICKEYGLGPLSINPIVPDVAIRLRGTVNCFFGGKVWTELYSQPCSLWAHPPPLPLPCLNCCPHAQQPWSLEPVVRTNLTYECLYRGALVCLGVEQPGAFLSDTRYLLC